MLIFQRLFGWLPSQMQNTTMKIQLQSTTTSRLTLFGMVESNLLARPSLDVWSSVCQQFIKTDIRLESSVYKTVKFVFMF